MRRLRRSRRDERGTSLVEFALILPVFSLLLFSLVDFGLAFGGFITLENHVNAAGRAISVANVASTCANNANPDLCTIEADIGSSYLGVESGSMKYELVFPDYATDGAAGMQAGHPVIVCAQGTLHSSTGVTSPFLNGRTITSKSQLLLEQNALVGSTTPNDTGTGAYYSSSEFSC